MVKFFIFKKWIVFIGCLFFIVPQLTFSYECQLIYETCLHSSDVVSIEIDQKDCFQLSLKDLSTDEPDEILKVVLLDHFYTDYNRYYLLFESSCHRFLIPVSRLFGFMTAYARGVLLSVITKNHGKVVYSFILPEKTYLREDYYYVLGWSYELGKKLNSLEYQ